MKQQRLLFLPAFAMAILLLFSMRSFGQTISVRPDSVTISAAVGTTGYGSFEVINNDYDSTNPKTIVVGISISGSSEITLSDTILEFSGAGALVNLQFTPETALTASAEVTVSYQGQRSYVAVAGTPLSHAPATVSVGNYDLTIGQQECEAFTVSNPNEDSIWVTNVELINADQSGNVQWSLENVTTPFAIAGHATDSIADLCAMIAAYDSGGYSGELRVVYNYGSGSDSATIQLSARVEPANKTCASVWGGDFGGITIGQTLTQTVWIENVTDSPITISSPEIEGNNPTDFTIDSPSFPITIPAFDTAGVTVAFTLPSNPSSSSYSAWFVATVTGAGPSDNGCNSIQTPLSGSWNIPISDSLTLDAPPGSSSLSIASNMLASRHAIFIQNDTSVRIELEALRVSTGDSTVQASFVSTGNNNIAIDDTLMAGGTEGQYIMSLDVQDTGTYDLTFTLSYEVYGTSQKHEISSVPEYQYHVLAHVQPSLAASVAETVPPTIATMSIMPNPANGPVDIAVSGAEKATIELYDVLGNLIQSGNAVPDYTWNGSGSANGIYIVRASGVDANGIPFVLSKRLSLTR